MTAAPRRAPGLLLIGASARNVGKTEFACAVVRRLAAERDVFAAKVTTVHAADGPEVHGGSGPGGHAPREAGFHLSEERGEAAGKDTTRLLQSGARRVFWLRTSEAALAEGAAALLAALPPGALWVCESNRLRLVVEPDLFVSLHAPGTAVKPSASAVAPFVDREVHSDGRCFDPPPEALGVVPGPRWAVPLDATLVVLAGGHGPRPGAAGVVAARPGRPGFAAPVSRLAPYFADVLVVGDGPGRHAPLGCRHVGFPESPDSGPLAGIVAALTASAHDLNLFVPSDAADVPPALALRLLRAARQADAAVVQHPDGRPEPLCAVYRRHLLPRLQAGLAAPACSIRSLFAGFSVRYVPHPGAEAL